ncbi:class I SAM-dependent methyltransferase [Aneurinibacillus uraniidurans]|uniref:class I SAM-dependent methyltransferase n=1 Tax=Aneurinibacillus uraniidurans TaxID=2966586 RepID=UPI0023497BC1|nr:class I SAM-dependent methyltransferase [Aneurinibacillus sp. B1]WCN38803.1 methyltransferase domain-containing protein [Aneurinibacillus sp. B1]
MEHKRANVMAKFDEIASKYDEQRKKLIPCFDDFYSIAVSAAKTANDSPNILDVGAGTGLLSDFVMEKYPKASLTLVDISEKMLEMARVRFEKYPNVTYIVDDYTKHDFTEKFDVVISSLSIHHLTDMEKKNLYERIFSLLKADGVFVNADQVLGSTSYIDELYKTDWKQKVENSGLARQEIMSAYERTKLDKMSTLEEQISWLKEAGFSDVDCMYKYFNFVVLYGRKLID